MAESRIAHSATLLEDGTVLIAGGGMAYTVFETTEVYDPDNRVWYGVEDMSRARVLHSAVLLESGWVLVAGGISSGGLPTRTAEAYAPGVGHVATCQAHGRTSIGTLGRATSER